MRGEMVVALGLVAILIGAGAGYLIGNANERTITFTSTFVATLTTTETLFVSQSTQQTSTFTSSTEQCPPALGCPPYPVLMIQGASTQVGSQEPTPCQTVSSTSVCPVDIVGGDSGKVTANVTFQVFQPGSYVGGAYVAFLIYSSAPHYVNFTAIPSCASASGASLNATGCNVPSNATAEFQFSFTVSPGYNLDGRLVDSVTLYMWQTCCFP